MFSVTAAEFWVLVGFLLLMATFGYFGIHTKVAAALDTRADRIKSELAEALRLRQDAAKLLADYQVRYASAEREADEIVANAKIEAERIAAEAKTQMEEFVARRTRSAENRIAMAEAQALADVRAAAAEAAVEAATTVLSKTVTGKIADDLVTKGIDQVRRNLN